MSLFDELTEITAKAVEDHEKDKEALVAKKQNLLQNLHGLDEKITQEISDMENKMREYARTRHTGGEFNLDMISQRMYESIEEVCLEYKKPQKFV